MPKALTRTGCTRVKYVASPGGVVLTVQSSHLVAVLKELGIGPWTKRKKAAGWTCVIKRGS